MAIFFTLTKNGANEKQYRKQIFDQNWSGHTAESIQRLGWVGMKAEMITSLMSSNLGPQVLLEAVAPRTPGSVQLHI